MAKSVEIDLQSKIVLKSPVICVIGGPGSGKSTLCVQLAEHFNLFHICVGDLLHKEIRNGTKLSREIERKIKLGENVDPEIILHILEKKLIENTKHNGYLVDGFPRDAKHGNLFEENIMPISCILYLQASIRTMRKRLLQRSKTSKRLDDNTDSIEKRIKHFSNKEKDILKMFVSKIRKVSSEQPVANVFISSVTVLNDYVIPKSK